MDISIAQSKELAIDVIQAGLVPMLKGSPGVGKSAIAKELADQFKLKLVDIRLSQCDPTDLMGMPSVNLDRTKGEYLPMGMFPVEGDSIPEGFNGWLVLLDEFNASSPAVQVAAYKILLDKMVGMKPLHERVVMIAAGNKTSDKAVVNNLSTATQSRLIHFNVEVDNKAWIDWAIKNNIDYRILAYIQFKPNILHNFNPNHSDDTFPCPRTWEFMSKIISKWTEITANKIPVLAGTIGEGAAREFYSFCQVFDELPTKQDLLSQASTLKIPYEPSTKYAVSGLISSILTANNANSLMEYISRMPIEFQIIILSTALKKDQTLLDCEVINDWIKINAEELL